MRVFGAIVAATLIVAGSQAQAEMSAAERVETCQPSPYDPDAEAILLVCEALAEIEDQERRLREKLAATEHEIAQSIAQRRAEGRCIPQETFDANLETMRQYNTMDLRCPD